MAASDFHELVLKYGPWSYSKVNALGSCGRQFFYRYVEKRKEARKQTSSLVGTASHAVLEAGLKYPGYDLEAAKNAACDKDNLNHEERIQVSANMSPIRDFISRIDRYKAENGVIDQYVEQQLAFDPDFKSVTFFHPSAIMRGVVDHGMRRPDDFLLILDHKSGKRKAIKEHAGQFYTYKLMAIATWPWVRGVQCGIHYIGNPRIDWFPRPDGTQGAWTREEIAQRTVPWMTGFLNKTKRKLQVIESGVPAPETSPLCAFCGYESECPQGHEAANAYRARKAAREGQKVNV